MIKFGCGFEQFDTVNDCIKAIEEELDKVYPCKNRSWYNVTGTPVESLWGSKEVNYNCDKYDFLGWGPDRQTPWGPLPNVIVAIRSDLAKLIRGEHPVQKAMEVMRDETRKAWEKEFPEHKPLRGKDWKPAPGFENY